MNKFDYVSRLNKIAKDNPRNNIAQNAMNFVYSTIWLTLPTYRLGREVGKHFIHEVADCFNTFEYMSMSAAYLIVDSDLEHKIKQIFKKFGIEYFNFLTFEDHDSNIDFITDDYLKAICIRGHWLHSLLIINLTILVIKFDYIKTTVNPEIAKKFNSFRTDWSIYNDDELDELAASCRSILLSRMNFDVTGQGGHYICEALIIDIIDYAIRKDELVNSYVTVTNCDEIKIAEMNVLTGNGFSKFITTKYLKENWLVQPIIFSNLRSDMIKHLEKQNVKAQKIIEKAIEQLGETDIEIKEKNKLSKSIENLDNDFCNNVLFIKSSKFISTIIKYIDKFSMIQIKFFNFLKENSKTFTKIGINSSEFFKIIDGFQINGFSTKNRNYLFQVLLYTYADDLFWNIETFLSIVDKFTNHNSASEQTNEFDADYGYIYSKVLVEVYIEKVWNKGKINNVNIPKKICANNVFTLNYDNITDKIFKESTHLHGDFRKTFLISSDDTYTIKKRNLEIGESYFEQLEFFFEKSSCVMHCSDNKMGHIMKLSDEQLKNNFFRNNMKNLSNCEGDFIIIGSALLGDPHIFDLITNKERNIYITYYKKQELVKLQKLLLFKKLTNRKGAIFFIEFSEFMKKIGL